jgi:Zn-dependent protease with chaperone function
MLFVLHDERPNHSMRPQDNLSFPVYDWLYATIHHSHPSLLERLAALEEPKKDK